MDRKQKALPGNLVIFNIIVVQKISRKKKRKNAKGGLKKTKKWNSVELLSMAASNSVELFSKKTPNQLKKRNSVDEILDDEGSKARNASSELAEFLRNSGPEDLDQKPEQKEKSSKNIGRTQTIQGSKSFRNEKFLDVAPMNHLKKRSSTDNKARIASRESEIGNSGGG